MFNVREGITAENDVLPKRFYEEKMPEGPAKGQIIKEEELENAKSEYYKLRGWDQNGIPTNEKLSQLEI